MIIVIDGYNILKNLSNEPYVSENQRKSFIAKVKRYAKTTKNNVVLVFDGGLSSWPLVTKDKHMTLVYSGDRHSADDWIKKYISDNPEKNIVLVTCDRELCKFAHGYKKATIDSLDFYSLVKDVSGKPSSQKVSSKDNIKKFSTDQDNPELDELMFHANVSYKSEEPIQQTLNQKNRNQLSKWERRLLELIKKL